MREKIISSIVLLLLISNIVFAQPEKDSLFYINKADTTYTKIKSTKLNFAIPDAPAFKALGADPSEILRPSDAKAFALMIPNFFTGTTLTIPTAFAAEISPGLLISNYTINDYYNNRFLRGLIKTRFSIGTSQDSSSRKLAFGVRTTLFEDKDFKADRVFINDHVRNLFLKPINRAVEDSVRKFEDANPGALDGTIDMISNRKEIKKAVLDKMGQQYSNLPKTID